ncbi:Glutathione S-transferase T3 [Bienertia sinuspersici]
MFGSPSPTPKQTTPANFSNYVPPTQNYVESPENFQGSSTQFNDTQNDEDDVIPETQQPIMSPPLPVNRNRQQPQITVSSYLLLEVGTNQKASTLWRKIGESYNAAQASSPNELPVRNVRMSESRWKRIVPDITLWASCYDEACKVTGSGYNDEDAITNATRIFRQSTNPPRNFLLLHVWKMLCAYPKWRVKIRWGMSKKEREVVDLGGDEEEGGGSDKRNRVDDDGDTVIGSSNYTSGGMQRLDGVKKSKSKQKGKGKKLLCLMNLLNTRPLITTKPLFSEKKMN